jgi:hypothetical protein
MTMQTPPPKDNKTPLAARANGALPEKPTTGALPVDLAALSDEQLAALVAQGQDEIVRRKERKDADFLASVAETAHALGIPAGRVAAVVRAKGQTEPRAVTELDRRHFVKPLLWNPKDHAQRWSKRGAPPKWYADHIAAGGTEEECVIPPEGAV